MISVLTWKWRPKEGYRSTFTAEHVNVLQRMVARHYSEPHRFICVTDDPDGIAPGIEVVPLDGYLADVPSPHGGNNPSCYRRLRMFAPDAAQLFGERFVSLDLDCVITGRLEPLWDRPDDFVAWGDTAKRTAYNGSMILLRAGSRPQVWETFDPDTSPQMTHKAGMIGSDQAWISHVLGPGEARWGAEDGVFSYRNQIRRRGGALPTGARVVFFHGHVDPWGVEAQRLAWVRRYWQ